MAKPISGKVLIKVPGAKTFAPLDLSLIRNGAEVDVRKGKVEITQAGGGVATFYDGIFKLSQSGGITTLTLTEKLAPCSGQVGARGGRQAQDPQALGQRQGQVPHPRPVQRRHDPRHQMAACRTAAATP